MSRVLLTTTLAAVLATMALGAGNWLPTGAWCNTANSITMIADGMNLALWDNSYFYSSSFKPASCRKIYAYSMDAGGNLTLNQLVQDNCYSGGDNSATFMRYDPATTNIRVAMRNGYSSSDLIETSLSMSECPNPTTSAYLKKGTYCGPSWDRFTTSSNFFFWTRPDAATIGGLCLFAGGYDATMTSSNMLSSRISWCSYAAPSTTNSWYGYNGEELWLSYTAAGVTQSTILNSSACAAVPQMVSAGNPLCVSSTAGATKYQNSMIVALDQTTYALVLPQGSYFYNTMCYQTGNYTTAGATVSLWQNGAGTCGSDFPYLIGQKVYDNGTMVMQNSDNAWFNAVTCSSSGLTSGTYCGGISAKMVIGGTNFAIWGDWNPTMTQCQIYGTWRLTTGGAIASNVVSSCGSTPQFFVYGNNVVVSWTRSSGKQEMYAFQMGSCMANTTTPTPAQQVPSGKYCMNVGGADGLMIVENSTFMLTLNNSWVSYYGPCAYTGWATHRNGAISYNVQLSGCRYSSLSNVQLLNMSYVDGQITFILSNSTMNTTVTSTTCPAAPASILGATVAPTYCPTVASTGMIQNFATTSRLWVWGNMMYYTSGIDNCFAVGHLTGTSGTDMFWYDNDLTTCSSMPKWFTKLANGDLYFHVTSALQASALSPAACAAGYVAPALTTGGWCGTVTAASVVTAAPGPASNMTLSAINGGMPLLGAAPSAKLSIAVGSMNQLFVTIEPEDGSAVCVFTGVAMQYATSMGYYALNSNGCMSNGWSISKIVAGTVAGTMIVSVQNNQYAPVDVTVSASSCTTWEATGLTSGQYCGGSGQNFATNAGWMQDSPVLVAGHMVWFNDTAYGRTVLANVSASGNNVTIINNYYWNNPNGFTYTDLVQDRYINLVSGGLSLSSRMMSKAYNKGACTNQTWLGASAVLGSSVIAEIGGRITAVFQNGTFMMQWDGTYSSTSYPYPCFLGGTYAMVGTQVSLNVQQRNPSFCGSWAEISSAWMSTTDGSINFDMWYAAKSYAIVLSSANCSGGVSSVPAGQMCSAGTDVWVCSDRFFATTLTPSMQSAMNPWVWQPWLSVVGFGNLTKLANQTIAVWASTGSNYPSPFYTLGMLSWSSLIYNAAGQIAWNFDTRMRGISFFTPQMCKNVNRMWDAQAPLVGAYCGYNGVANMTFIALPNGTYYWRYESPQSTPLANTNSPKVCYQTGMLMYSQSTKFITLSRSYMDSDCLFSDWSYATTRVRFTGGMYFNDSAKLQMWGSSYYTEGGEGTTITFDMLAANCPTFANKADAAATLRLQSNLPSGVYWTQGAWLQSTMVVLGNEYGVFLWRGNLASSIAFGGGLYSSALRSAQASGGMFSTMSAVTNMRTSFLNASYDNTKKLLNVVTYSPASADSYVTLPLAFNGETQAQQQAQAAAAADDKKDADDKKTGIIIGVIIAVVIVLAIIAAVVVKSRGGSSQPSTQPGGQDYRPMNSV